MEAVERLSVARRVLARAEESVGVSAYDPAVAHGLSPGGWELPEGLAALFPQGLMPGMSMAVRGSRIVTLMLAGVASSAGAWGAFLGCPDMGWGMARLLGVDLDRTVCVPRVPGERSSQVATAAIDGFEFVVAGPGLRVDARQQRLLAKRALTRGCLLIGEGWGMRERIRGRLVTVEGVKGGSGHIRAIDLEISRPGMGKQNVVIDAEGWHAGEGLRCVAPPSPTLTAVPHLDRPSLLRSGDAALAGASSQHGDTGAGATDSAAQSSHTARDAKRIRAEFGSGVSPRSALKAVRS